MPHSNKVPDSMCRYQKHCQRWRVGLKTCHFRIIHIDNIRVATVMRVVNGKYLNGMVSQYCSNKFHFYLKPEVNFLEINTFPNKNGHHWVGDKKSAENKKLSEDTF